MRLFLTLALVALHVRVAGAQPVSQADRYRVTLTAISSLAINRASPGGETAAIIGTGTLVDTSTREQVAVGVPLIITAADRRDSTKDQLGLTLLKTDGGIWLATGWNGVQTVEQPISEGQIQVEVKK